MALTLITLFISHPLAAVFCFGVPALSAGLATIMRYNGPTEFDAPTDNEGESCSS